MSNITESQSQSAYSPAEIFSILLVVAICSFPIIGTLAPRALSFLPPLIGVIGYGAHYFIYKNRAPLSKPALYVVLATFILCLISSLWSIDPEESLERCLKMLPIFIGGVLLFSVVSVQGNHFYQLFPKIFLYTVVLCAAMNAFEMLSSGLMHNIVRGQGYAYVKNLSHLNRNVVILTFCLFPAMMAAMRGKKYILLAALIIFTGLVYARTDSQSAHLAFMVGVLVLAIFPVKIKPAWGALLITLSALLLATPWLTQYMFNALPQLIEDIHWFSTSYAPQRLEIWDFVSRYALQNPLYGFGVESTKMVERYDTQMLYHGAPDILHPHNFAVQFWMEFGVLGPLFLIGVIAYMFRFLIAQNPHTARLNLTILMTFISTAATGYGFWQGWLLGAMIMIAVNCIIFTKYFEFEKPQDQAQ